MVEARIFIPTSCKNEGGDQCKRDECVKPEKYDICIYGSRASDRVEVRNPQNGISSGGNSLFQSSEYQRR